MRSKKALLNMIFSLMLQMLIIISGLIVPRLIISKYGSSVNGLTASITQFLSFLILLQAGVDDVVTASLYKPLANKNSDSINSIIKATENFFKKISYIAVTYVGILAIAFPLVINNSFNYVYTAALILIIGIGTFAQYYFGITYQILLQADQKNYIHSIIQIIAGFFNLIIIILLVKLDFEIHIVKLASSIVFLVRPVVLNIYVKRKYEIKKNCTPDNKAISQRWDGVGHTIASFIHNNTDVFLLTIFTNFKEVSVYLVYSLVTNGLKTLISTVSSAVQPALGNMIAKDENNVLYSNFKSFECLTNILTVILFTSAAILILPFIHIYTKTFLDVNYFRPIFAFILISTEGLFCLRQPYHLIIKAAGHYKQTRNGAFYEALINIIISILFIQFWGIEGVVTGTFFSMLYRLADYVFYLRKNIIFISLRSFLKRIAVSILNIVLIVAVTNNIMKIEMNTYTIWLGYAMYTTIIATLITLLVNSLFYVEEIKFILIILKRLIFRKMYIDTRVKGLIKSMKISIAGTGYVGLVAGICFAEIGHKVTCVDIDKEKIKLLKRGISPIYEVDLEEMMGENYAEGRIDYTTDYKSAYKEADAIFIGVGTPEQADGSADLSNIAKVARQIAESVEKDCLVVIKSTVPVGTNDKVEQFIKDFLVNDVKVEVASNPEFLSQGSAIQDTLQASRIIIGTESKWAEEILEKIYEPFNLPMITVSRCSAEMIKYATNDFLALKISYINDIANLCELVGADIKEVTKGMSFDKRIGDKFLNAGVGYGGSCFPKDTRALEYLARQNGYDIRTIKATIEVNKDQKTLLYNKACKRLITFEGLKTAIFGLTFKPGTDDLREAPSLDNVPLLLEQGAEVYAYDPVGADNFKKKYPEGQILKGSIKYVDNFEEALSGANICFIFTEWDEIKAIKPEDYKKFMKIPLVYDGRNIYEVEEMERAGVEYHSIGRKFSSISPNMVHNTKRLHLYKINLNHEF